MTRIGKTDRPAWPVDPGCVGRRRTVAAPWRAAAEARAATEYGSIDPEFHGFHGWDFESATSYPCDTCNPWPAQINASQAQSTQIRQDQTRPSPIDSDQGQSSPTKHRFIAREVRWTRWLRWLCVALLAALFVAPSGRAADIPFDGTRPAPEFPEGLEWLNTEKPLTLAALKGKIVILDFWTYCCINCMHIIPDLKKLEAKYSKELVVIGVHSAKFDNEKLTTNIREAIQRYEIEHPVVNDRDMAVWRDFGVRSWPTLVLINPNGKVIGAQSGEGIFELFDAVLGEAVKHFDAQKAIDRRPLALKLEKDRVPRPMLAYPGKIIADAKKRRIYFTDSNHNRVIVATIDGEILEVIGEGEAGLLDGDFSTAQFFRPQGLCLDAAKNILYVADTENHAIRRIDLAKKAVETLAGTGQQARRHNVEGRGREVALNSPWDLLQLGDTLYIAMAGPHQLWSLGLKTSEARVHAGSGRENILDGPLKEAQLAQPSGITTDGQRLYFADSEVSSVRVADVAPTGRVDTLIGEGLFKFGDVDGKYPTARLQHCLGVAWRDGVLYVADTYNHKIKRVDPRTRELTTFAGTGKPGAADGERLAAQFNEPNGLCFVEDRMLIADSNNHLIRACDLKSGRVTTLAWKNPGKLRRSGKAAPSTPEFRLPLVKLAPDAKEFVLAVQLPRDTKLNPLAKSTATISTSDAGVLRVPAEARALSEPRLVLPITAAPGRAELKATLDLLYCAKGNEGLCYFKSVRLVVPVEIVAGADAQPSVEYRVEN
jgi:sugar lactone lactonase YvrE